LLRSRGKIGGKKRIVRGPPKVHRVTALKCHGSPDIGQSGNIFSQWISGMETAMKKRDRDEEKIEEKIRRRRENSECDTYMCRYV